MRSRSHGSRRAFFYACTSHYNRGETVCPHLTLWPMDEIDREIMATLCSDVFRPSVAESVVAAARTQFEAALRPEAHSTARAELAKAEREVERLTEAIASGGAAIPAVMDRLRRAEATRQQLVERLAATPVTTPPKWADIERRIRKNLIAWRTRFSGGIAEARVGLKELLTAPILFEPCVVRGHHALKFSGRLGLESVFGGTILVTRGASPAGNVRFSLPEIRRSLRVCRVA